MARIVDRLWLWGHAAGSHNGPLYRLPRDSRMTQAEAALYMGIRNLIQVRYGGHPAPPHDQFALTLRPLDAVVWSVVGAGGETSAEEIDQAVELARRFPNFTGLMMDDFFLGKQGRLAVHSPADLEAMRKRLTVGEKRLDLWVVLYDHQLGLPVSDHLGLCDVVTFWTWEARNLARLEGNFERFAALAGPVRKVLGCYMYDYGGRAEMPVDLMSRQCELGLRWLETGWIEGLIFLASCICDLELPAVEWSRDWIAEVGGRPLPAAQQHSGV